MTNGFSTFRLTGPAVALILLMSLVAAWQLNWIRMDSPFSPGTQDRSSVDVSSMPLVFIHGFKGSALAYAQGGEAWLNWRQALGIATPDLRLPLLWDGDIQRRDGLEAESTLRTVAWQDIYGAFLNWGEASGRAFYTFAYDWRRDNLETVDRFLSFLSEISRQHGGARVQVVAHSLGGLITFVALNRRPDLFHSVLFAGVPFSPGVAFSEDMHAGTATGLNKRILSPQVLFTFVPPYSFFPFNTEHSGLVEPDGRPVSHDWYLAEDWERERFGIFGMSEPEQISEVERAHLRNALRRSREFRSRIVRIQEPSFQYPPIAVLASDAHPTLSSVIRNGPRAVRGWDFQTGLKQPGDGRVVFDEAMPPAGVPHVVYKSSKDHGSLLQDTTQVSGIVSALLQEASESRILHQPEADRLKN